CRLHGQAAFRMAGVMAERDWCTVGRADAAVRAEDQDFLAGEGGGIPTHAGVLGPAEEVAGGPLQEHFWGYRERAARAGSFGADVEERSVAGIENRAEVGHLPWGVSCLLAMVGRRLVNCLS